MKLNELMEIGVDILPMGRGWAVRVRQPVRNCGQHVKEGEHPSAGRGCRAGGFATTRCGCSCTALPEAMADGALTSLQLKLIEIGGRVARHADTVQLAEVAVTGPMVRATLAAIRRLRAQASCA